ncbi:MAG: InlB B-repeat-containing protein [Clostridiales bacterium]|nr:InlB B-repeat-containing protein [Clostridiales bacterium]
MIKRRLLSLLLAVAMIFSCCALLVGCIKPDDDGDKEYTVSFDVGSEARSAGVRNPESQKVKNGETAVQPTVDAWEGHTLDDWYNGTAKWNFSNDTVTKDVTLTAQWRVAVSSDVDKYEEELTWGEPGHLYVHYLRGDHSADELGITNSAAAPGYSTQINSTVYGDWGIWAWEYVPVNGEGRAFYPMKIDVSGAVYDIDLTATYNDAGWDSATRNNKGLKITYATTTRIGLQIFSQDSRVNGEGFWVNDGGDVYVRLSEAKREKGDYHWFVSQGSVGSGSPVFTSTEVNNPYDGIEPGSAVSGYDVVSNKGNNDLYTQQPVAEGWEENSVGYQIFIASFADSDGDGMGDLRGIIENLDYLKNLGVDTLWLTPFQSSNSYHGYDIMDYFSVDPRFGTLEDYRELIYTAHKKGMKVLLDFVLNHTSQSNPWFVKSQNLVKETITLPDGTKKEIDYRNFYNWQNEEYVSSIKDPVAKAQWYKDPNGYYFYSSFSSSMPELNFDYQATRDAILEVALYWMSFGLDGFRLDAVKHIYMVNENENHSGKLVWDGGYSYDVDKNVHFFREFNAKLKASYPSAILVGENFNGNPANLAPLYEGLDSQFNFNWYYDTTWNLTELANGRGGAAKILNQYEAAQFSFSMYRKDYIDGTFVSNHDVQRARDKLYKTDVGVPRTAVIGDADWTLSENLAKLYAGLSLTVPGITWIYNGDELGMFGTKTANGPGEGAGHEDRWYRQPMKWTTEREGSPYNCYYLMGFNNYYMGWDALNTQLYGVEEQLKDPNSILNLYKDIIAIRRQYSALARGTVVSYTETSDVICYSVKDSAHEILIYVNATAKSQKADYALPTGATLLYGSAVSGSTVGAMSISIYLVK